MEVFRFGGGGAGWKDWEGWQAGVEGFGGGGEEQRVNIVCGSWVSEAQCGPGIGGANVFVQSTGTGEEM